MNLHDEDLALAEALDALERAVDEHSPAIQAATEKAAAAVRAALLTKDYEAFVTALTEYGSAVFAEGLCIGLEIATGRRE